MADVEVIHSFFSTFGRVMNVHILTREGHRQNFMFVHFLRQVEAHKVLRWGKDLTVKGKSVFIANAFQKIGGEKG